MPRVRRTPLLSLLLALVMLIGALGPSWMRVATVAHAARMAGACLPSQGSHAAAVRQGRLPQGHDQACEHCASCASHQVVAAFEASGRPWMLLDLAHVAPRVPAWSAAPDLARAPPRARGPPSFV